MNEINKQFIILTRISEPAMKSILIPGYNFVTTNVNDCTSICKYYFILTYLCCCDDLLTYKCQALYEEKLVCTSTVYVKYNIQM